MFGAYQAGAWEVLAETFQPDLVVGASIGSLNGWAIAGGCNPRDLTQRWLELHNVSQHRLRFPFRPLTGVLDAAQLHAWIRQLHETYQPKVPYGVVLTDLLRLRPTLFEMPDLTWEHLAASCAIFGVLPQIRIGGRLYTDGGLLHPLPLWAATAMGATDILAINVLPYTPNSTLQTVVRAFRRMAPSPPCADPDCRVVVLEPARLLGTPKESIYWSESRAREWIELGRREAQALVVA